MRLNVIEYLEETLGNSSQKTAVIDEDEKINFGDLADRSKILSMYISNCTGGIIRKPIAVYIPKSINNIISDIGIIYSGNAYMNLDVKSPVARISSILECIQPILLISDNENIAEIEKIWDGAIINIDEINFDDMSYTSKEIDDRLRIVIDTDPLCIINTSGSTGTPKGVVLNHKSFINFTDWANKAMNFSEDEAMGCLSPTVFDIYSYELCLMMSRGAVMVLLQESMAAFPARMLQTISQQHVTFIFWVPTIMVNIANMGLLDRIPLTNLKTVWFAGEVFPTKQFNIWRRALPNVTFVNMYGPIEITLDCTHYIISRELCDDEPIPIGYAMPNTDVILLNDENKLCTSGEDGELCVRGTSLAMGYYNNLEKTAEVFVQNPLNTSYPELIYRTGDIASVNERGEIMFKGRKDSLVKHSGYRIELSEIEHIVVNKLQIIDNGCVIYNHSKKEIVLYYEAENELSVAEFKKNIGEVLPRYMIPTVYIHLNEMPRNANGKIDRLKLNREMTK